MSTKPLSITSFNDLANPTKFLTLSEKLLPWLWSLTICLTCLGLYMAFTAPEDYQQGITVRIMYIHVPAAWLCMMCYTVMTISSIGMLVWKHPLADVAARAAAPLGAGFTVLALLTGSLWGRPMWGTWWVWDARLTSVFVLLIMYLGLIAYTRAVDDPTKSAKTAAILTIVGWVNIPIIKFSVDWWNTLHQPASVIRADGPSIHPSLLYPLLVMALAFTFLFFSLHLMAMRNEIFRRRVRSLRRMIARSAS